MARKKHTRAPKGVSKGLSKTASKVAAENPSSSTPAVDINAPMSADSLTTAYALLDKDVAQDANLLTPDADLDSNDSSSTTHVIAEEKKKPTLMSLPNEVKQNIWTMAVFLEEDITPMQIAQRSNKFVWSLDQCVSPGTYNVSAVPPLMAVNLSSVCKAMYNEVSKTHLFYRHNKFNFSARPGDFKTYIVGLTDARRQSIRYMHVELRPNWRPEIKDSMVLIASCKGLKSLDLSISSASNLDFHALMASPEHKHAYAAVQGLKDLNVVVSEVADPSIAASFTAFKNDLAASMAKPRTGYYNQKLFLEIQVTAPLDVHGEGRLSDDKKPGIISSRTRAQKVAMKSLDAVGVRPPRNSPKYDLDGCLAWDVLAVLDSRETGGDDGSAGIEFEVECWVKTGYFRLYSSEGRKEICWEDASVLGPRARHHVVNFYRSNPEKSGLEAVYKEWLQQIDGEDENPNERLHHLKALKVIASQLASAKDLAAKAETKANAAAARNARIQELATS
ncbi:hypothetical protein IFR05_006407 [Cadophora sp. M221]|nr:hypothetical protein IFR05_006407 [Cadophora sp. M221]